MSLYSYTAKRADGQVIGGQLKADSEQQLAEQLRQQQLTLVSSTIAATPRFSINDWFEQLQGVSTVQKIFFTQNLTVMLRGGFSISRAMGTLALQSSGRYFRKVILGLKGDVESGISFSQALRKYPRIFSDLFINMIAAGEVSGKLDEVLRSLTKQLKKEHQLISKVRGAMTYPVIVVIAMIAAAIAMVTFVIPKLLVVFEESKTTLPLPTRILIAITNGFQHYGLWIGLGVLGLIILLIWVGRTSRGHWVYDQILIVTPIVGPIVKKINLARFTRNLSSMLATDIPIIQTFQIIGRTLSSAHYRQAVEQAGQALKTGASVAKVLERYPKLFPPLVQQMISVGEESGTLDDVSNELAIFYEEDVDQTMANLSTIIEPVLLLFLGAGVAGIAVSVLLPMYSLTEAIN